MDSNVNDIDFYAGGLLETSDTGGALIGPTFSCKFLVHYFNLSILISARF